MQNVANPSEKVLKPWHMCTHLRVLSENYPMNTSKTAFRWFSKNKSLRPCASDECSCSIGRVENYLADFFQQSLCKYISLLVLICDELCSKLQFRGVQGFHQTQFTQLSRANVSNSIDSIMGQLWFLLGLIVRLFYFSNTSLT